MDDWVRAINRARRKLSEKQEEERYKREGARTPGLGISSMPPHNESHGTILSSSPVAAGGYFPPQPASAITPILVTAGTTLPVAAPIGHPASPIDTTNTLTSQLAKVTLPAQSISPRMPTTPMLTANQGNRSVSSASARREPSGGSFSSATDYFPRTPTVQHPPALSISTQHAAPPGVISSDEEETYFSDPNAGFPIGTATSLYTQAHSSSFDPKKVILSAYLMKRSKGRGRKLWRKRWFYLTSQGLTYTKSHMVRSLLLSAACVNDI